MAADYKIRSRFALPGLGLPGSAFPPISDRRKGMKIEGKQDNGRLVVSVEGRMDAVSAPEFDKRCEDWISAGVTVFILNFGGLEYISSAGLRSLLVLGKKLTAKKGRIVIAALKDVVKEVFTISGFGSIFTVVDSVEAALGPT
jgi:anti-anti-sigma factor